MTMEERKERLQLEIEKRKHELKEIARKEKAKSRKMRTHRLCKLAGKLDAVWPKHVETMTEEEYECLLKNLDVYITKYRIHLENLYSGR